MMKICPVVTGKKKIFASRRLQFVFFSKLLHSTLRLTDDSIMSHLLLAMSGGVDSSVAASLLLEQGHTVSGVYMRHSLQIRPQDCEDAQKTADLLGVPLHVVDIDEPFQEIVDSFCKDYLAGRTPNPCALCNRKIKFGRLLEFADSIGTDGLATGHYVRLGSFENGLPALCQARDWSKDQSYLLYGINPPALSRLHFPLGNLLKSQVREKAKQLGLPFSEKKDSQEICFVEPHRHVELIRQRNPLANTSGHFVSTDGKILGKHDGYEQFTIGQRKGMKVGFGQRVFVVRIDAQTKNVVIGNCDDLAVRELVANEANWFMPQNVGKPFRCDVKIRYRNEPSPAEVVLNADNGFHVRFDAPKHGVAPGQIAVCYLNGRVLGGGTILTCKSK